MYWRNRKWNEIMLLHRAFTYVNFFFDTGSTYVNFFCEEFFFAKKFFLKVNYKKIVYNKYRTLITIHVFLCT